ncbi:MAG: class I tRNA ligase family protein, partial [Bacteroidales bacterium]|nr:class I tRNA ligase family protein [Bacteroidales bacterium]
FDGEELAVSDEETSAEELKVLHKLIGKEEYDIEHFSFNTTVSAFMIALNDLSSLKCRKRAILEPLVVLLSPFAPHIAEELWSLLGHKDSVTYASFPVFNPALAAEDNVKYPVSFNGKTRFIVDLPKSMSPSEVEAEIRGMELTARWVGDKSIAKVIVVPGRIVNIVIK